MEYASWLTGLYRELHAVTWPEAIAVAASVASVLLARKNHVLLYPFGILSTLLYTVLLFRARLYADSLLNLYYLVMSLYGWFAWTTASDKGGSPVITYADSRDRRIAALICAAGFALLYVALRRFTDSTVPAWDAAVSATAWAGMWLLARHKVENWLLLNLSNLIAVPLLFYKQLPATALLTVFLFVVACFGYRDWRRAAISRQSVAV